MKNLDAVKEIATRGLIRFFENDWFVKSEGKYSYVSEYEKNTLNEFISDFEPGISYITNDLKILDAINLFRQKENDNVLMKVKNSTGINEVTIALKNK